MINSTRLTSRTSITLVVVLLLALFAYRPAASALVASPSDSQPQVQPQTKPSPEPSSPTSAPAAASPDQKITPAEAKELFDSVDEILQFVSRDTGLPIKHPVKRKLASRAEVERYVQERMKDDEDSRRLERSEVVLKKFALLPRDFDLRSFMVGLLGEQVAGFYNTKDKTVYLLDWVQPEAQKPVLAHELTHALQDQNFGLDKWLKQTRGGKSATEQLSEDDRLAARQAVSEGQAMVTLLDYMLEPAGRSLAKEPSIADPIMNSMMNSGQTPMFTRAPLFLKELLVFPYQFGLRFERDVLVARGPQGAFADTFRNPPSDTRQVMQPATYLSATSVPLLSAPDFEKAVDKGYQRYDISSMGEFDVWLLLKQYADRNATNAISPAWRGGFYYAAVKPGVARPQKGSVVVPENDLALAYVSKWADAHAAQQFAGVYAGYLAKRYDRIQDVRTASQPSVGAAGGTGTAPLSQPVAGLGVEVASSAAKINSDAKSGDNPAPLPTLEGRHAWTTGSGPVTIEVRGDTVLILESFDSGSACRLTQEVFGAVSTIPCS